MYLIAIAWFYVVLMMSVAEAISTQGTLLGAVITFVFYGVLPLALVMYIVGAPGRKRLRRAAPRSDQTAQSASVAPDGGSHAAREPIAPKGEES